MFPRKNHETILKNRCKNLDFRRSENYIEDGYGGYKRIVSETVNRKFTQGGFPWVRLHYFKICSR